jgi:hypothetical protein
VIVTPSRPRRRVGLSLKPASMMNGAHLAGERVHHPLGDIRS